MLRSTIATLLLTLMLACAPAVGLAQQQAAKDYPSRPIRLVVPYAPGGPMDFIGHVLGQKITPAIGQNFLIDNRPGAGGAIGTEVAAKAQPDGYTILLTSSSHVTLPSIVKSLPYDPLKDFTPITLLMRSVGSMLVVHPSVPARSVKEFIALARAHPGKLNYGSGGVGNVMQFAAESFSVAAGTQLAHVPYKGVGQAIVDLLAGRIELCLCTAKTAYPHVQSGKLRALGIAAPARWSYLPEVPTMDETGLKGYAYGPWYGLWFPANAPAEYVARIRSEVVKALEDPAIKRRFIEDGLVPMATTTQEFAQMIENDMDRHRKLAARMGITPQ
jgi:tripartite-type tricarboxylate transporter receptor subunit TctC